MSRSHSLSFFCSRVAVLALTLIVCEQTCSGQVNFNNGIESNGITPMDILSDDGLPIHIADDFVLPTGAATLSKIQWRGYFAGIRKGDPIPSKEFNIEIYDRFPGASIPAMPLHAYYNINPRVRNAGVFGTPKYNFGVIPVLKFTHPIPRITLDPGRTYWICIYGSASPAPHEFAWAHTTTAGNTLFRVPSYSPTFFSVPLLLPVHVNDVSFKLFR